MFRFIPYSIWNSLCGHIWKTNCRLNVTLCTRAFDYHSLNFKLDIVIGEFECMETTVLNEKLLLHFKRQFDSLNYVFAEKVFLPIIE